MYELKIGNDLIYRPGAEDLVLAEPPVMELELNSAGTLEFGIHKDHPYYNKLQKHKTVIDVYDSGDWIYSFRVLNDEKDFYNVKKIECEGVLNFLLDSIQRPFEHKGTINNLFTQFITVHNNQVDDYKKFDIGTISVVDSNNYLNRSSGYHLKTLNAIRERLIDTHGGYLRVRKGTSRWIIDYIEDYGQKNSQVIRFGENLLDLNNYILGDTVKTAIIPLGAETETEGINGINKRVTIESVNGGKDYIYSPEAVKQFGYIWDTVTFDDVTIPSNLLAKAKQYLSEIQNLDVSIEISAIDLAYVDVNAKMIRLGDWQPVISTPHELDTSMLVSKLSIDIENPDASIINLGTTIETFTESTTSSQKNFSAVVHNTASSIYVWMNDAIQNATDLINGGTGGYVVTVTDDNGQPRETLYMDKPVISQAKNILRINMNGIGFSTSGVNGPFLTAWTIDGRFNADFITAGTIKSVEIHQYYNGNRSISINRNQMDIYSWKNGGKHTGSVGSTYNSDYSIDYAALWAEYGNRAALGVKLSNGTTTVTNGVIVDERIKDDPPWIRNTASGTLFSSNSNGGVVIKNGLIKTWSLKTATATMFPNNSLGGVVVKSGLIEKWNLKGASGNIFSKNPSGGITVKDGLIEDFGITGISSTVTVGSKTLTIANGLIVNVT